ncbi:dual specificity protein phosphatase 12-like [Tubulanus polymorphus]|uniref:dual specificity protein phosphatase 12-like n=1 Tax=Tubulanus polymorphus TaxID=672921 RepID=UPI003DA5C81F
MANKKDPKPADKSIDDLSAVGDGLYLGNLNAATQTDQLRSLGVTHILTLDCRPLSKIYIKNMAYKYINLLDSEDTDLLRHFNECFEFMDDASKKNGSVLVHCYAGQSRSCTIMIAYLMYRDKESLNEIYKKLQNKRPTIRPNAGFMNQLELFEAMGNRIDLTHEGYKLYRLKLWAQSMKEARQETELSEDMMASDPNLNQNGSETIYKCRKCRRPLFRATGIQSHEVGQGDAAFDWRAHYLKQKPNQAAAAAGTSDACNQSLFIEPVQWMSEAIMVLEGKLACPKCHCKLGSFNWCGDRCSCGTWITPAFHIQSSKVDLCRPVVSAAVNPQRIRTNRHNLPVMNTSTGLPVGKQIFL